MHRALAFSPVMTLLASCSIFGDSDDGAGTPAPPDCEAPCDPYAEGSLFESGAARLAAGTTISLRFTTDASPREFRVTSDDPTVLAVEGVTDTIQVAALAPGSATLSAEALDGSIILDQKTIRVVEVSAVEFRVRTTPVEPEPIGRIAGLLGSSDSLRVLYLDSYGHPLAGRGRFAATGSVEGRDPATVEARLSERLYPGESVAIDFLAAGPGALSAYLGERSFTLPVEVVRAVPAIEVVTLVLGGDGVVESDEGWHGQPAGADVIARRRDGIFILGVHADWTIEPAVELLTTGPVTEVVFIAEQAGTYEITAAHGALSATRSLTVQ